MLVRASLAVAVLMLALATSATASSAAACGQRLVKDWAADARVDGAYSISCYRQAMKSLPEDLRAYSSAPADIYRALQAQLASVRVPPAVNAAADGDGGADALVRVLLVGAGIAVVGLFAAAALR